MHHKKINSTGFVIFNIVSVMGNLSSWGG